jgi:L-lactate dehydrogenase complex protein LldG
MQTFKTSKAKENILARVRKGLNDGKVDMPFPEVEKESVDKVYANSTLSIEETFADAFIKLGGKFVYCDNEQELMENIANLHESNGWGKMLCSDSRMAELFQNNKLDIVRSLAQGHIETEVCITDCETLVARTGSVILTSKQFMGRTAPVFYPVHIIIAYANQIVPDIDDAINLMKKRYSNNLPSMINLNTGPSRTADIEKTLVVGVHGPGEVFCFYVNA